MKLKSKLVHMQYCGDSWCFVDAGGNKVKFDQALVDATRVSVDKVSGYVASVHGISAEVVDLMPARSREDLGIKAVHSLGRGPTLKRVRLMPNGSIENES